MHQTNEFQAKLNPITGQHVELTVQSSSNGEVDKVGLKTFLAAQLPNHMMPKRIKVASVNVVRSLKQKRGEPKDHRDIELMGTL